MEYFGQNLEDKIIHEYFGDYKGRLLDIGANTGTFLSNSLALINLGWSAHLLEPGETCVDLMALHEKNDKVIVHNFGIGEKTGKATFYESDSHVRGGTDKGLVSSTSYAETERWRKAGVNFRETTIHLLTFKDFYEGIGKPTFEYISIDAEGYDKLILEQIDLQEVGCRLLCVEWNGDPQLLKDFTNYTANFGMRPYHKNNENLIFVR